MLILYFMHYAIRDKLMVGSTKVLCPENLFNRRYKGRMFRPSHYMDIRHLCRRHRHLLWLLLTNLLAVNILLYYNEVNDGLGIKSTAGLKTFVFGHNAFAHPLKFDELLIKVSFLTFCPEMGKCFGNHVLWKSQFRQKVDIVFMCSETSMYDLVVDKPLIRSILVPCRLRCRHQG